VGLATSMARKPTSTPAKTEPKPDAPAATPPIAQIPGLVDRAEDGTITVTERGLGAAQAAAAAGVPLAGIATMLGCSASALRACRERQPALDEALTAGLSSLEYELVGLLMKAARKGAFVPALFLLKAKFGYRDSAPPAPEGGPRTTNVFMVPSMSPEQFRSIVEGTATPVADVPPPKELTHGITSR
jgi:hypothetical protein